MMATCMKTEEIQERVEQDFSALAGGKELFAVLDADDIVRVSEERGFPISHEDAEE